MDNWDDMRYFLALSRSGSVSGAARALSVNHTTVSRRIQALEYFHGVRLFERGAKGYEMTEAASDIYELALSLESQHHLIARKLMGVDERLSGVVNITLPHDIYETVLVDDIAMLQKKFPDITIQLSVSKGLKNLAHREADIAIRLTAEPPEYLIGKRVANLRHAIYAPKCLDIEHVVPIISWSFEDKVPHWAIEKYGDKAKVVMRMDDLTSMHAAVAAGTGAARMPMYLPDSIVHTNVEKIEETLPYSPWGVWVLSHVDLRKTTRVQACKQFLMQALAAKINLFEGK